MTEIRERTVVCPFTGETHTVVGPQATRAPSREIVEQWVRQARRDE
ncbi:hypothetical protein V5735_01600 (plasmid) [Haladaptatus sp. SPP-AMP-3]